MSRVEEGSEVSSRTAADVFARGRRVLLRASSRQRRRNSDRTATGRLLTATVCLLAGLMVVVSALNARGIDLRPGRNTDLVSLVQSQSRRNAELARQLTGLRAQVDALTADRNADTDLSPQLAEQARYAGLQAVTGPAVTVTLDDAPTSVIAEGVEADYLVVHQQDIQAVVNALWEGGAEAMTIQGQRVISTTGIKCVGNTVVLHGIPYAPPYVIRAVGSQDRMAASLNKSDFIGIYKQYVAAYGLVYDERTEARAQLPAHEGALELQYARSYQGEDPPTSTETPR
ncbi:MAG: hypothetical protein JWN06_2720 [Propionibacteriaceae bacterium]|jgi:uncharacterized protein YlxW (UPF0749 family)|nr:hypothetical protein [Propionibacteriaceae bacterium]